MNKIFEDELSKYKDIKSGEKKILAEEFDDEWEWFEEKYLNEHKKKPNKKETKAFIKEFMEERAFKAKDHLRQVEKEAAQIDFLEDLFIREGLHLSIKEISDKLFQNDYSGSSIATIYRRIKPELEKMGLKKDADGKYYYERNYESILNRSKIIEENELTGDEKIETLAIISNFLETIKDSPVYKKAQKYLKKEQEKIEAKRSDDKDQNYSRVIFMGAPEADIKQENWESIYRAMHSNTPIKLYYIPEGKKGKSIYRVQPYQLIFDNGCWDLWAECIDQSNRGKRLFNLSRICKMEVLERAEKFSLPSDYDFLRTMSGNFGCYNDWDLKRYKILFRKDSYAWLFSKDRIWGDNQSTEESDEGFIINFEATQFKPVLRWVLGWGDEVEPLEPPELVAEWKSKIKKMAEKL